MRSPSQPPKPPAQRRFADDAERDAVILSPQDIELAQEAIVLARADREAGREPPGPDQPRGGPDQPHPAPTPSWGTVLATTVRLRWQRRVWLRWSSSWWRGVTVVMLVAVVLAWTVLSLARAHGGGQTSATSGGNGPAGHRQAAASAALRAAAAARTAAAGWLAQQAASDAIVACDPQMCAVAQQAGVPAGRLQVLSTTGSGPLGSDLLVATAAVRQEFGARLASVYAPDVLASFGTGGAQVAIRVVAPDGAAAYRAGLRADQAARVSAGQQLLRNPRIHVSAAALPALANGRVDARLLTVFAALATLHSVRVLGFAAAPPGMSPRLPLRSAEIAPGGPGLAPRRSSVHSLVSFLRAQLAPYRPDSITEVRLPGGGLTLRVEFAAPSPLGLLGKS